MSDSSTPVWYETSNVCALASAERHLGHAVRTSRGWTAYDGTRTNMPADGFKELGTFVDIADAKIAIEDSLGINRPPTSGIVWTLYPTRETPGNKVHDDVFKMPIFKINDQTRYRD